MPIGQWVKPLLPLAYFDQHAGDGWPEGRCWPGAWLKPTRSSRSRLEARTSESLPLGCSRWAMAIRRSSRNRRGLA